MSDPIKVHGVLSRLITLSNAVGFSHDRHYLISVNLDADSSLPDATLVYDMIHDVWWYDDFGVTDAVKDKQGNVYGSINGTMFQLYTGDTDAGDPIRRIWRSHPYYGPVHQRWNSIHVFPQAPAVIDVAAYTEQDRVSGTLKIANIQGSVLATDGLQSLRADTHSGNPNRRRCGRLIGSPSMRW